MVKKKVFDYDSNRLYYKEKSGFIYNLQLRGKITVIDGKSATGKSMLVNALQALIDINTDITDYDAGNICILDKRNIMDLFPPGKNLLILDRADLLLTDKICAKILGDTGNKFLIFSRGNYNLGLSPNYFGEFIKNGNEINISYPYNEKGWF